MEPLIKIKMMINIIKIDFPHLLHPCHTKICLELIKTPTYEDDVHN